MLVVCAVQRGLSVVDWCLYRGEAALVDFCVSHGARANLSAKVSVSPFTSHGGIRLAIHSCAHLSLAPVQWFPGSDATLLDVLKAQMSEALLDSLHLSLHRGGRIFRQKAAVRDVLLIFSWMTTVAEEGPEGKRAPVKAYFPSAAVEIIAAYQC